MNLRTSMLVSLLVIFGVAGAAPSGALADQKLNVNIPAGGAQDMLNMTQIPSEISNSNGDTSMQRSCITPAGRQVRETDDGYQQCLAAAHGKKAKTAPTNPNQGIVISNPEQ